MRFWHTFGEIAFHSLTNLSHSSCASLGGISYLQSCNLTFSMGLKSRDCVSFLTISFRTCQDPDTKSSLLQSNRSATCYPSFILGFIFYYPPYYSLPTSFCSIPVCPLISPLSTLLHLDHQVSTMTSFWLHIIQATDISLRNSAFWTIILLFPILSFYICFTSL